MCARSLERVCGCGSGGLKLLSGRGRSESVREREERGSRSCRGLELRKGTERTWVAADAGHLQPECGGQEGLQLTEQEGLH